MQYLSKSFSVGMNLGDKGRENYDRIFGKKKRGKGRHERETTVVSTGAFHFTIDEPTEAASRLTAKPKKKAAK